MDKEKMTKVILGLGIITVSLFACDSLLELSHKIKVHSLERKIYKQQIKFNNEIINYVKNYDSKRSLFKKGK